MENVKFYRMLLREIEKIGPGHTKRFNKSRSADFFELLKLIAEYFKDDPVENIARDYMHMVADMRREMKVFFKTWEYSCKSQAEAYEKVYSQPEIMSYYMNGLLLSQLLWKHHFKLYQFFKKNVSMFSFQDVLEIGAGHGLYSAMVKKGHNVDVSDVSEESLVITRRMLGDDVNYSQTKEQYDLIILGEVLEHLDDPVAMLKNVKSLLKEDGVLWVSVPVNAPAIDHVYLFKNKNEVHKMIEGVGLQVITKVVVAADSMTQIVGIFCKL